MHLPESIMHFLPVLETALLSITRDLFYLQTLDESPSLSPELVSGVIVKHTRYLNTAEREAGLISQDHATNTSVILNKNCTHDNVLKIGCLTRLPYSVSIQR